MKNIKRFYYLALYNFISFIVFITNNKKAIAKKIAFGSVLISLITFNYSCRLGSTCHIRHLPKNKNIRHGMIEKGNDNLLASKEKQ